MIGIYIHIPFCLTKCPYCDFYSLPLPRDDALDRYTEAVCDALSLWREKTDDEADTLYFGGGTPSLLGGKRLGRIMRKARKIYGLKDAEITLEANPGDSLLDTFSAFRGEGGNRISLGMQAANNRALAALGRRHTVSQTETAVREARRAGIDNISLDLMLAVPHQTADDVRGGVRAAAELGATHLSCYLLKIEPGTPFAEHTPDLPDDDEAAESYLAACDEAERAGFSQYEISNFAIPGKESRHNLKYWNQEAFLGIGPSAHGYLHRKRMSYPRSLDAFLRGEPPREEPGSAILVGGEEEYAMLRLRLVRGLEESAFEKRFGKCLPAKWRANARLLPPHLVREDAGGISLTREGFLLSNTLIGDILWGI